VIHFVGSLKSSLLYSLHYTWHMSVYLLHNLITCHYLTSPYQMTVTWSTQLPAIDPSHHGMLIHQTHFTNPLTVFRINFSTFYPNVTSLRSGIFCRISICRLSVCLSSVTYVRPTQLVEIFGNVSMLFCTVAVRWHPCKILQRSSQGNPSVGG